MQHSISSSSETASRGIEITISSGTGEGPTLLAAFDAALLDAGVGDYNLITLSSVIPPSARVRQTPFKPPTDDYGRRMYAVLSQQRVEELGQEAWAGLGWVQNETTGRGLFVELHGHTRHEVEASIQATLETMKKNRQSNYGPIHHHVKGIECQGRPVCALVVAVYTVQKW